MYGRFNILLIFCSTKMAQFLERHWCRGHDITQGKQVHRAIRPWVKLYGRFKDPCVFQ